MPRSVGQTIADSLSLSLSYSRRMLTGVTPEQFGRLARFGDQVIDSNHGAFVFGHLALYGSKIVEQLGGDAGAIAVPPSFATVFSKDAKCVDDPSGTIYPSMDEVTSVFFQGYEAAIVALQAAPDEVFQKPNPGQGRIAELFPTLGSMHTFYCGGHLMMHMGQVSAWRRMLGLPPA